MESFAELERVHFGTEVAVEEFQALVDVERLEQFLFETRVFADAEGGEVGKDLGVFDGLEEAGELVGDGSAKALLGGDQAGEAGAQAEIFVGLGAGLAGEGLDADATVGVLAHDGLHLDAGEALDEEVGGAVVVALAGAHDADGGDAVERLELVRGGLGVEAGDGKEAVGGEHVAQHFLIAGLEDVEGEKRLREKSQIRQGHDGDFVGHHNFHLHAKKRGAGEWKTQQFKRIGYLSNSQKGHSHS